MLQSPRFLYRLEQGEPVEGQPGVIRLSPYERASRLYSNAGKTGC